MSFYTSKQISREYTNRVFKMVELSESIHVIKRSEHITDIVMQLREPMVTIFMDLWTSIYQDPNIPKTKWLQAFQLSLKKVKDLTDDDLAERLSHKKKLLSNLYEAIMLTAYIHHDRATPHITNDKPLLFHFVRDCAVQVGREIWSKPYLMHNMTHRKGEVATAREVIEKVFTSVVKYQLRHMVDDIMIVERERLEKCREIMQSSNSAHSNSSSDDDDGYQSSVKSGTAVVAPPSLCMQPQPLDHTPPSPPASVHSVASSYRSVQPPLPSQEAGIYSYVSRTPSVGASPAQSVKEVDLGKYDRRSSIYSGSDSDSDDLDDFTSQKSVEISPRGSVIDHLDYIPLKKDVDRMSRASVASSKKQGHKIKAIRIDNGLSSTQSSDSDDTSIIVEKKVKNKVAKKKLMEGPKGTTSYQKYGYYRDDSSVASLLKKKTTKRPAFFK